MKAKALKWILLAVLAAAFVAAQHFEQDLTKYHDVITITCEDDDPPEVLSDREVLAGVTVRGRWNLAAEAGGRAVYDVAIYQSADSIAGFLSIRMISGGFSLAGDGAVIEDSLAWRLFPHTDCVGRTLTISGKSFTVTGVYQKTGDPAAALADRERHAVFTGITDGGPWDETAYLARCRPGTAAIMLSRWERSGVRLRRAVNLDANARAAAFWIDAPLLIALLLFLRGVFDKVRAFVSVRRPDTFLPLVPPIIALGVFGWKIVSLRFAMDARFIPSTPVSPGQWLEKAEAWRILLCRGYLSGGWLDAQVCLTGAMGFCCAASVLILSWALNTGAKSLRLASQKD